MSDEGYWLESGRFLSIAELRDMTVEEYAKVREQIFTDGGMFRVVSEEEAERLSLRRKLKEMQGD